jgi:BON domain
MNKMFYLYFMCIPVMVIACQNCDNQNDPRNPKMDNNQTAMADPADTAHMSDNDLRTRIKESLSGGWFGNKFENVSVNVSNGVVTITGTVLSDQDKQEIENRIKDMPQVRKLIDLLQVNASAPSMTPKPTTPNQTMSPGPSSSSY